jgi:hypothetical protein
MTKQELLGTTEGVPYSEITVIVHGPILKESVAGAEEGMTQAAVRSVRKVLPGAKVIVSTWLGSAAEALGADHIVYSPDPGSNPYGPGKRPNNVNRQIAAMRAGLERVTTRWTLKLRSDTVLVSDGMVSRWGRYPERHPYLRVFDRRIVTSALLTYHPTLGLRSNLFTPFLFHVNDMIQFGLTTDMRRLWGIPFMPEADFSYFSKEALVGKLDNISNRRVPEDYIWTRVLQAAGFPTNDSWLDFQPKLLPLSELSIVNNFQLLDHADMGFVCLKYPNFGDDHHPIGVPFFTHRKWLSLYGRHCDPSVDVPWFGRPSAGSLRSTLRRGLNLLRWLQFLKRLTRPLRHRIKRIFRG